MPTLQYTATQRLKTGSVLDTVYIIEFALFKNDFNGVTFSNDFVSLNGTREVQASSREDDEYAITIQGIKKADLSQWREFFYSVKGGEVFLFDMDGSIAIPDAPFSCVMLTKKYRENRVGTTEDFTISFSIRVNV